METILYNISQVVGVAIIHSMWQGLFIYLFLRLVLLSFSAMSAKSKHNIGMLCMLGVTSWFIYTLVGEVRVYQWVELKTHSSEGFIPAILSMPLHLPHSTSFSSRYYYTIESFLPYVTLIYIAGLLFNASKLVMSRKKLHEIKQTVSIDIAMLRKLAEFVEMLDIERRVSFGLSTLVDVPCVFGYVKPFILLPASIATSLSTEEIEAILLHELAHIKRNDYLMNLIQQAMGVLLFFNPFAQLIGRIINRERENACDDIVIESTKKPIVYAHALLKLEQSRTQQWQIALAATGKTKYHLLNRIERIMKTKKPIGNVRHILLATVVLTASITGLAWLNPTIAHGKLSFNKIQPAALAEMFSDTTHKKAATKTTHKPYTAKKTTKTALTKRNGTLYTDADEDPMLQKYSNEMDRYGKEIEKYYNSPEFKKYQEQMEIDGKKMEAYYNSPEWKKTEADMEAQGKKIEDYYNSSQWKELTEKQEKMSKDFEKNWGETAETKEWSSKMEKMGKKVGDYYESAEFRKLNNDLETKYNIPHNRHNWSNEDMKDENYRKYRDELESHIPADVKQATDELKTLGNQMKNHWGSPEMRKQQQEMRMMGDSVRHMSQSGQIREMQEQMRTMSKQMRDYQNNPEMKKLQEEMRTAGAQMRAYQNNPEMKKLQEQMRATGRKMREYMNTPEFRKKMDDARYMNWNFNYNNDEKPEKPEAPEKPEKPDTTGNQ
ncbi:MAG: M56 family metallopeptidase [Sphingobacteriales bacterium]